MSVTKNHQPLYWPRHSNRRENVKTACGKEVPASKADPGKHTTCEACTKARR